MSQASSHQEMELLPAAALETLEEEELGRVLAHARECAECGRLLDEYREVAAVLGRDLPPEPLEAGRSARLRARLLVRARNAPPVIKREDTAARARFHWGGVERWAGWAVAAGLAGVLLVHHGFHRPLAYGWVVAGVATLALVAFGVYATIQRRRVSALENQLARLEREQGREGGPRTR